MRGATVGARWLLALVLASPAQAQTPTAARASVVKKRTTYEDLQMFTQVLNQLRVNHPDSLDSHELIISAIRGMLAAADPHSYVVTGFNFDADKDKAYRENKLYPVPIDFIMVDGAPVVVSVSAGSTASMQDILPGDELVRVDTTDVHVESPFELSVFLSGPKKSWVSLEFLRRRPDGTYATLVRSVMRERVEESSAVPVAMMLDGQTGYVRITTFDNLKVADDLHDQLKRLERQGMQRLVLDLRDNGGGFVKQAAVVAGEFLPKGTLVYTASGRKEDVTDTGRVSRSFWSHEKRYPIAVMINNGTASAAELVAGALQDHDRALIVGHRSFGKSLLMRGFPLTEGSLVMMVIGQMRTPCGRVIQREYHGVARQSYYHMTAVERDTAGRPWCKSTGGRTLYGGGGIEPDVVFPAREPVPDWLLRANDEELMLKWIAGHVAAAGSAYGSLDTLLARRKAAPGAVADFRAFAAKQGVSIPNGPDVDARIERSILRRVAQAKWGNEAYFRVDALLDDEIKRTVTAFDKAEAVLRLSQ